MKKILVFLIVITTSFGCHCKKAAVADAKKHTAKIIKDCAENAVCTEDIFKDSALEIATDGADKPYYTIVAQPGTTVYRYQMAENQDQQYLDGGYREELIFQLPSDFQPGTVSGKQIFETKALFGVFCYCKGKAGYYTLKAGKITKTDKEITLEIPKVVEDQKVFTHTFKL